MNNEEFAIERYHRPSLPTPRDAVAVLFRQRWALGITFAVVILGLAVTGFWVPKYDAHMKILVRRNRSDAIVTSSTNAPTQLFSDQVTEEDINSEVELLNSQDLLRKVAADAGLSAKSPTGNTRENDILMARAVKKLSKDLKIEPLRKSNVISVHYASGDPQLAERVLQALSAAYTEKHLEVHRSTGELTFFDQQMQQYKKGVSDAQAKLDEFTKTTGVVSAEQERDAALKQADEFESVARQAQSSLLETEQRIGILRRQLQAMQPRTVTVVRTSDNPQLLEQLKSTLLNLQLKRTELLTKYQPTYRLVQEVDQQIADTKAAITGAESKPVREESSDQNPDYQLVKTELTKAEADMAGLKARADSASAVAARYHGIAEQMNKNQILQQDLQREAKTQQDNYFLYMQKREEARISNAMDQRGILNVAMAEQPVVPALPESSPLKLAVVTLLLAGSFSLATAVVKDFMDPSFRTPDELANYLGMPVLASLPRTSVLALPNGGE